MLCSLLQCCRNLIFFRPFVLYVSSLFLDKYHTPPMLGAEGKLTYDLWPPGHPRFCVCIFAMHFYIVKMYKGKRHQIHCCKLFVKIVTHFGVFCFFWHMFFSVTISCNFQCIYHKCSQNVWIFNCCFVCSTKKMSKILKNCSKIWMVVVSWLLVLFWYNFVYFVLLIVAEGMMKIYGAL